jgi:hypothetical protein
VRADAFTAFLVTLISLAGTTAASSEVVNGPRFTVGDFWTYHTNTSLAPGFYLDGELTLEVTAQGPVTIEGASYDAVRMWVTGSGAAAGTFSTHLGATPASGSWLLTGEETLESAGLKVVSSVLDLEMNGTFRTPSVAIPFLLSVQNTTNFRFFGDAWRFPAPIGNTSVVAGQMNFSEDFRLFYGFESRTHTSGRVWWNVTYALETAITVDPPAGPFDAYRIRETAPDESYGLFYYAPATGNDARTETYNGTSRVATNELVSYRYQALEPNRFLGLTLNQWGLVGIVAAVGASAAAAGWIRIRRRSRRPESGPPPPD